MAISNLVLTQQIYSKETNGAHAHYREPVPLNSQLIPSVRPSDSQSVSHTVKQSFTGNLSWNTAK